MKKLVIALLLSLSLISITNAKNSLNSDNYRIEHSKFVLDNGLTLIVHQDKKAPIVAVNVWYHVGSKDEQPGRTGFAHLFEHLMFNGSENYNDDWFAPFSRVGASGMNGTTNQDRTNYFQVVPKNALEMTLWMESDRMGHLLGAIDQAKLDEQRDVVKNEKRQGENQPYGRVFSTILENVYPAGHPYSWSTIGSMEDLDAASVEDVHQWFKTKYGAANATIVIAGDIEPQKAKTLVEKYFGHIEAGPPQTKLKSWIAKRSGKKSKIMHDRVSQARVYKIWNIPEWGTPEADYLSFASAVLSSDKKSRLYNRLVYKERVATDVSAFSFNSEIGGLFGIVASASDPEKLDYIEQAIDEELAKFIKSGPTKEEISRIKNGYKASLIRGMERVGGFGGKSDLLARNEVFSGDPLHYMKGVERILNASADDITNTSKQWLSDGEFALRVLPFNSNYKTTASTIDRSKGIPAVGAAPTVKFDELQKFKLDNGLSVVLAERNTIPVVKMQMIFDSGFAADQADKRGVADLTMQMLDEGAGKKDALQISGELANLGTNIYASAGLDFSVVAMDTIKDNLTPSLALFSDIVLRPNFPNSEFTRIKAQHLNSIKQAKTSPGSLAYRLLPNIIFGKNHVYSGPFDGSGTEQSVASINIDDLRQYHQSWFKSDNATLIVTGDISKAELEPMLNKAFAKLPSGETPKKIATKVTVNDKPKIYLVDRPGSAQSFILASTMIPEYGFDQELALQLANDALGSSFTSRINMNLREDKGWSYGARSSIVNTRAQRPLIIQAPVQTDSTSNAMLEINAEVNNLVSSKPVTAEELARSKDQRILTLPGRWETLVALEGDVSKLVKFKLPASYWDDYITDLKQIDLTQVNKEAKKHFNSNQLTWLVVGDRNKIEESIRQADIGELVLMDAEGNIIQ